MLARARLWPDDVSHHHGQQNLTSSWLKGKLYSKWCLHLLLFHSSISPPLSCKSSETPSGTKDDDLRRNSTWSRQTVAEQAAERCQGNFVKDGKWIKWHYVSQTASKYQYSYSVVPFFAYTWYTWLSRRVCSLLVIVGYRDEKWRWLMSNSHPFLCRYVWDPEIFFFSNYLPVRFKSKNYYLLTYLLHGAESFLSS